MDRVYLIFFLSCLLCSKISSKSIDPRDLLEEAQIQVDELKEYVRESILNALVDVDILFEQSNIIFDDRITLTESQIESEYQGYIRTYQGLLVSLNQTDGTNPCIQEQEVLLFGLKDEAMDHMNACLQPVNEDIRLLNAEVKYRIDMSINEANLLEFQIGRCGGDESCLERIIRDIQAAMISVPQKIDKYIEDLDGYLKDLDISNRYCTSEGIKHISILGPEVLRAVVACVVSP